MANQVSLLAYLQYGSQALPIINQGQSPQNTRSEYYRAVDITNVGHWAAFNLATTQPHFGVTLNEARIVDEPANPSLPRPINSDKALEGRTVWNYDAGNMAMTPQNFLPDIAVFDPNLPPNSRPNHVPGVIKPSYKWSLGHKDSPNPGARTEIK